VIYVVFLEVRLVDAETSAPIRYTPVWADRYSKSTDEKGVARFEVPPGSYTLKVRSPMYEPYTWRVESPGTYEVKLRRILL